MKVSGSIINFLLLIALLLFIYSLFGEYFDGYLEIIKRKIKKLINRNTSTNDQKEDKHGNN